MIPVTPQPEPATFDASVRKPGEKILRKNPTTTFKPKGMDLWRLCLEDLRKAYNGVCSYCCLWVPTFCSVDHYEAKTANRALAYEWSNYRLAHQKLNVYKGEHNDVLDPFHIHAGWFVLEFANSHVKPNDTLPAEAQDAITRTITRLRLNTDDTLVQQRFEIIRDYSKGLYPLEVLTMRYPFIAAELQRQGVVQSIKGTIP